MASTSIFAPIVPAMQAACVQTDKSADIIFTLSDFNILNDIQGVFVSIIDPNKSATNSLNSMIKKENFDKIYVNKNSFVALSEAGSYKISFDFTNTNLFYPFSNNQFYQIQLYLVDSTASDPAESASWWNENQNKISVPSQVTLIRFIEEPSWVCDVEDQDFFMLPSKATFFLTNDAEPIDSYSFQIIYKSSASSSIETIKYSSSTFKTQGFKIEVPLREEYFNRTNDAAAYSIIRVYYKTKHGYSGQVDSNLQVKEFGVSATTITANFNPALAAVQFEKFSGYLQKKDKDGRWQDKYIGKNNSYIDYDIDFKQSKQEYRLISTSKTQVSNKDINLTETEDIYLSDKTAMMIVSYNPNISGFKYVTQEAITNTLGGKYPVIRRNAHTKYRQFTLTGLICIDAFPSYEDVHSWTYIIGGETFTNNMSNLMTDPESNFYVNTEYVPAVSSTNKQAAETEAREKVIDFLTNGELKLFRSFEEGNMIVYLSNISFTPNKTLGRHIYDFSVQVTEACEYNEENLTKYKLNNINYTPIISGSVEVPDREPVTMVKS